MDNDNRIYEFATSEVKEKVLEEAGCVAVAPDQFQHQMYTYCYWNKPFAINKLNIPLSMQVVQNRLSEKVDEGSVSSYRTAIGHGDRFPALVLYRYSDECFLAADGIHTGTAIQREQIKIVKGVYLFAHPEPVYVAGQFNARTNGVGERVDDRIERAVRLYQRKLEECMSKGVEAPTKTLWAKTYRIPEELFLRAIRIDETRQFLADHNVPVHNINTVAAWSALNKLRGADCQAAVRVGKLTSAYNLAAKDVQTLVEDYVDPNLTPAKRVEFLDTVEQKYQRQTNNGTVSPSSTRKPRSPEILLKAELERLATLVKRANIDKVRSLLADPQMRKNIEVVQQFIQQAK